MPTRDEHAGFLKIAQELGSDVFSLRIFGSSVIVLNSSEAATNLLEKRSGIYSDQSSDHLSTSEELEAEFYRALSATLADYVYGYKTERSDDPLLLSLKEATNNFITAALPGNFLVNVVPALVHVPEWFPGASWKHTARQWREQQERAVNTAYEWTKAQMAQGEHGGSIVASLLGDAQRLNLDPDEVDDYVKHLAVTMFVAGPDTIASTLLIFIYAMLLFPEVQERAQREIDAAVTLDRLPIMEDRPNLKYVDRLIDEVLRWRPIAPLGVPHSCSQDDVYRGYHIPKGAIIIGNIWAMTRDENVYKDPEIFDPDRYLDPKVPRPPAFGFGRRMCPGLHYAKASLFLTVTSVLAVFSVTLAKNADGCDLVPKLESANQVP
ncbi:hypothetical protein FRC06_009948, partial [Ceratobasidium sp. 370]